jgi:hypothetical protein
MVHKTSKYDYKYNLQIGYEFLPVKNKPVEVVGSKVKKYNNEYKTRARLEQKSSAVHPVYLLHCLFVWKESITKESKTCCKDNYAKNDKEDIPKAISDSKSHFLTVNI